MKKKLNIAYFSGGADFTLGPFFSLLKSNHNIKIVYSKAPKPSGRGKNIKNNVLINEAKKNNILTKSIDIFECNKDIKVLKSLDLDYIIVFSFGLILPKILLDIPKKGCLNIHTSLLPKWRGASPIQNSLINNEKETGFTFIMMNEKLDEGDIILKKKIKIEDEDNYNSLLYKIINLASNLLVNTLEDIYFKTDYLTKQNNDEASYCYKIKKKDTYINFSQTASEVYGKIRAFSPVPGAKCFVNGELLKVLEAKIEDSFEKHKNHSLVLDNNLLISCGTGSIRLTKVQRQGKKVMSAKDILNGWNIEKGVIFNEETQN